MAKTYTAATVKKVLDALSAGYLRKLEAQRVQIDRLTAEKEALEKRLSIAEGGAKAPAGELDMDKILRPDPSLRLDSLCRELGVIDDEE